MWSLVEVSGFYFLTIKFERRAQNGHFFKSHVTTEVV